MAEDRGGDDADKTNTAQEHHHDLYHYVFIIVGSIVTAGIEFALVWPENHHLALVYLVGFIGKNAVQPKSSDVMIFFGESHAPSTHMRPSIPYSKSAPQLPHLQAAELLLPSPRSQREQCPQFGVEGLVNRVRYPCAILMTCVIRS